MGLIQHQVGQQFKKKNIQNYREQIVNTSIDRKKVNYYKKKETMDKIVQKVFFLFALLSASFVIFIIVFIIIKGIYPFIHDYSVNSETIVKQDFALFFTNSRWLYDGSGGMGYLLLTTLYTTLLSLIISVPTSILTSLFIVKIVHKKLRPILKTSIELLASIPSVIFGLFGKGVICPLINNMGVETFGGRSIFAGTIVLAIMTIPTITMLSISAIEAVDNKLIEASLSLGASKAQTNIKIVLTTAESGIFAGIILGIGRALGEATAIQMVIGNNNLGQGFYNIFNPGNTLTSAMLSGIGEASGIGYDVRFSLGLVLILVIFLISTLLNFVKKQMMKIDKKHPVFEFIKSKFNDMKIYFRALKNEKENK